MTKKRIKIWIHRLFGPWLLFPGWHLLHRFAALLTGHPHTRVVAIITYENAVLFVRHQGHPFADALPGGTWSIIFNGDRGYSEHLQSELRDELGLNPEDYTIVKAHQFVKVQRSGIWRYLWIGYTRLVVFQIILDKEPELQTNHEVVSCRWYNREPYPQTDIYTRTAIGLIS